MNREKASVELASSLQQISRLPGEHFVASPHSVTNPAIAADHMIDILQRTYVNHGIANNRAKLASDIKDGTVEPWFVLESDKPVACAALVHSTDNTVEIGRAASLKKGQGIGKALMLLAALSKGDKELQAEVRLADEFMGVSSAEATQHISFGVLDLIPHAILPAFAHGDPLRREMFAFSSEKDVTQNRSPLNTARSLIADRTITGKAKGIKLVAESPFAVAIPSEAGMNFDDFAQSAREIGRGCTLIPIEVTDDNLATIGALSRGEFVMVGMDRKVGENGKPIILFATIGKGTLVAPTKLTHDLPNQTRSDISAITRSFAMLTGAK